MSGTIRKFVQVFAPFALLVASPLVFGQAATDVDCSGCVDSSDIAAGSIKNNKLAEFAVQSNKLAKKSVTSAKIADGAVTKGKLKAGSVSPDKLDSGDGDESFDMYGFKVSAITSNMEMYQGGYDLITETVTSMDPTMHFNSPSDDGQGNTTIILTGGENVLVHGSAQVSRTSESLENSNVISGAFFMCYRQTFEVEDPIVVVPGFDGLEENGFPNWSGTWQNVTPICLTSAGTNNGSGVSGSYLFENMQAGTYEFGVCASTNNDGPCAEYPEEGEEPTAEAFKGANTSASPRQRRR